MESNKIDTELKFKEWREFLTSVNDDLNRINQLIFYGYDSPENIRKLSDILNGFVVSKSAYITNEDTYKNLNKIEEKIYDDDFCEALRLNSPSAKKNLFNLFKALRLIYSDIVKDLVKFEILPKPTEIEQFEPTEKYKGVAV